MRSTQSQAQVVVSIYIRTGQHQRVSRLNQKGEPRSVLWPTVHNLVQEGVIKSQNLSANKVPRQATNGDGCARSLTHTHVAASIVERDDSAQRLVGYPTVRLDARASAKAHKPCE
eukprot:7386857-Prymnesium_polylepis.1